MLIVTKQQIYELAKDHQDRFTFFLFLFQERAIGWENINITECQYYLNTWKDIETALNNDSSISDEGRHEIYDALMSGKFTRIVPRSDRDYQFQYNGVNLHE